MCCPLVFEFSVGIGGFVIGLGQISFFFSFNCCCRAIVFQNHIFLASNLANYDGLINRSTKSIDLCVSATVV